MPQANMVSDRAEAVRKQTLAILSSLTKTATAFGLPDPASSGSPADKFGVGDG